LPAGNRGWALVSASAHSGYHFVNWTGDNGFVATSARSFPPAPGTQTNRRDQPIGSSLLIPPEICTIVDRCLLTGSHLFIVTARTGAARY